MIFNLLLAAVIVLGILWPAAGEALAPGRTPFIVAVMFLMALTLPGDRLRSAATDARGLTASALVGYVLLPVLAGGTGWILFPDEPGLLAGMAVLGALPCTLASAAVWTRMAGGDDALALVYTVASNVASVVLAPLILYLCLSKRFDLPVGDMFQKLALVVLVPVAAGQLVRALMARQADRLKRPISEIARGLVLCIVLIAVSSMAQRLLERPQLVASLTAVAVTIHGLALVAGAWLGRLLGLDRRRRIGVLFAGSQKTLFVGVFLAQEYQGSFGDDVLVLLPITVYHVVQLVIDTVVAGRLAPAAGDP